MVGLKDNDSSDHTDIVSLFVIVLIEIVPSDSQMPLGYRLEGI